ncbi:phosphate-starvation-inducible PsiE family protein [Dokdonella sp.]|uniref:phosphate-starvation-inducible PsiE family protein n=1 Tax=Dokdonella sp. TaxID=2291710 RepID=UPI002F404566
MRYLEQFERLIVVVLVVLMAGVVLLATIELAWILVQDVITPPVLLLEIQELLDLFGLFLLVLIGIELLHSVRTYIVERTFHIETVLAVAMIAVARKVIVLDPKELPPGALLGIAALVVALSFAFYVLRRGGDSRDRPD